MELDAKPRKPSAPRELQLLEEISAKLWLTETFVPGMDIMSVAPVPVTVPLEYPIVSVIWGYNFPVEDEVTL